MFNLNYIKKSIFIICLMITCSACNKKPEIKYPLIGDIALKNNTSGKSLKYDSTNFSPQVKNKQDIETLTSIMRQTLKETKENNDLITASHIMNAFQLKDFVRLEFLLYSYEKRKLKNS
jgi:hypothetical protein